jgi:hypothetical protein
VSKRSSLLWVSTASRVCVWAAVRSAATADHPLRIVTIAVDQPFRVTFSAVSLLARLRLPLVGYNYWIL